MTIRETTVNLVLRPSGPYSTVYLDQYSLHTEYLVSGDVEPGYTEGRIFVVLIAINDQLPVV